MIEIRQALNAIVGYWRGEGDNAPASELWKDAAVNLRWRMEREGLSLREASRTVIRLYSYGEN